jgi:alkanesulfonate monooxygenase SsuD/methylene tetrahydromethanopterin reductase-like flavin-dependent oxidoreductase (luciferase family)
MNIVCVSDTGRVRAVTDSFRKRWRSHAKSGASEPLIGLVRQIVIADSDEAADSLAAPAYRRWFDTFTYLSRQRGLPLPPMPPATFEEAKRMGLLIAGSPAKVRKNLLEQASDAGINYVLCQIAFGSLPLEASLRTASTMASDILPHFAEASLVPAGGEAPAGNAKASASHQEDVK